MRTHTQLKPRATATTMIGRDGVLSRDVNEKLLQQIVQQFSVRLTDHMVSVIDGDGNAALHNAGVARQFVPSEDELTILPDEDADPIGDDRYSPVAGIVHRYPDRVLLKVSHLCAVYCRYCFRKEMIGAKSDALTADDVAGALDYIRRTPDIWEVILTGGDPLILSPRRLKTVLHALDQIDHVAVIRIHTRIPVVDPKRVTDELCDVLAGLSKAVHIVLHINHKDEASSLAEDGFKALRRAGCSLLSQSVLLKGVNDDVAVLESLFRYLVRVHVKPYYLHHLDRARGTSHFRVPMAQGRAMMKDLQGRVSGLCLPTYMLDIPAGHGKIPINGEYVTAHDGALTYQVEDYQGCTHLYVDTQREHA